MWLLAMLLAGCSAGRAKLPKMANETEYALFHSAVLDLSPEAVGLPYPMR
ncbi:exported hypothetical protein [Serratia proteamaculans]|nr:exported hypothetical protein [Serratia proteamaculans]